MAISNKGLRTITVNQKKYKWKFNKKIFITAVKYPNSLLVVDWGWYDILEPSNNKEIPDPLFATPIFVKKSIDFALENNWLDNTLHLKYKDGIFSIDDKSR